MGLIMGKFHSKHGECFIDVNGHVNSILSTDSDCSQLPLVMEESPLSSTKDFGEFTVPLKVVLPPLDKENTQTRTIELCKMEKKDLHTDTDTTDNNISLDQGPTVRVEEFECGVSVEGGSSDRQEWSFTLYDFDGRGRVTKEDLGQLLKSLYDAVGSSISLPQTGTKSLKLRLTVSPDHTKVTAAELSQTPTRDRPDLNRKECNKDKEKYHSPKKDINSRLNNGVTASPSKSNNSSLSGVELRNNLSKSARGNHSSPSKRLSVLEQRQLAELVHINMQQNQQKSHKLRRHHSEMTSHHTPKRTNRTSVHVTHVLENPDRRNYYLDLAGIENPSTSDTLFNTTPPVTENTRPHRVRDTKSRSKSRPSRDHKSGAKQSRLGEASPVEGASKDSPFTMDTTTAPAIGSPHVSVSSVDSKRETDKRKDKSQSKPKSSGASPLMHASTPTKCSGSKTPKASRHPLPGSVSPIPEHSPQTVPLAGLNTDSSPHHRKHKHREKNHLRAMQQVAEWIENEQLRPFGTDQINLHEHHHIHEHHHHHHYHHYHET